MHKMLSPLSPKPLLQTPVTGNPVIICHLTASNNSKSPDRVLPNLGAEPAYFAALHPEAVRSACHDYMDNVVHVGDVNIVTDKYRCGWCGAVGGGVGGRRRVGQEREGRRTGVSCGEGRKGGRTQA